MTHLCPFLHQKSLYFKKFLDDTFFYSCSSYFRVHPTTLLLKILGGRMHGPSPHLKFLGDRPPVPLSFRPCQQNVFDALLLLTSQHVGVGQICYNKGCFVWRLTECSV